MRSRMPAVVLSGMLLLLPSAVAAQGGLSVGLGVGYVFDDVDVGLSLYAGPAYGPVYAAPAYVDVRPPYRHRRHRHLRHVQRICWDGPWYLDPYWYPGCVAPYSSFSFTLSFGFGVHYSSYYDHYYRPHPHRIFRPPYRFGHHGYAFGLYDPLHYGSLHAYAPLPQLYYGFGGYGFQRPGVGFGRWTAGYAPTRYARPRGDGLGAGTRYKESPRRAERREVDVARPRSPARSPAARAVGDRSRAGARASEGGRSPSVTPRRRGGTSVSEVGARGPGTQRMERPSDRLRGSSRGARVRQPDRSDRVRERNPGYRIVDQSERADRARQGGAGARIRGHAPTARARGNGDGNRPSARVREERGDPLRRGGRTDQARGSGQLRGGGGNRGSGQIRGSGRARPQGRPSPSVRRPSASDNRPSTRRPSPSSVRGRSSPNRPSARRPSRPSIDGRSGSNRPSARRPSPSSAGGRSSPDRRPAAVRPGSSGNRSGVRPSTPRVRGGSGIRGRTGGARAPSARPRPGRRGGGGGGR